MGKKSLRKGKRTERKACKLLESLNPQWKARRSQQYSGDKASDDSADIITNIPGIRFEVKGGKNNIDIYNKPCKDWVQTAKDETPEGQQWAILRKKDRQDWTIIFEMNGITVLTYEIKKAIEYLSHD